MSTAEPPPSNLFWRIVKTEFALPDWQINMRYGIETPLSYIRKFETINIFGPPRWVHPYIWLWSFLGSFIGIAILGVMQQYAFDKEGRTILFASLGASAGLIFGMPETPLAQPRNVIGGHTIAATIGLCMDSAFGAAYGESTTLPDNPLKWLACALSTSITTVLMMFTKTMHPPAGGTSLIPIIGSPTIKILGWLFIPVVIMDVLILIIIGILINNIPVARRYPQFWW
eukprot:TRINITY_DN421_c0_g2_i1.p1 TRINITY_DN421_c0_g2~~TRINITY_DN421_c0_g2_i1.p1  ORF type:complete len:235 (-),score=12.66 TRINITY_DN421_c0_g2_i1:134-817(-)